MVHVPDELKDTFKEIRKHKKVINIHQRKLEAYKIYFREGKVPGPININIAPMNDLPDELWDMWWQIQRKAKLELLTVDMAYHNNMIEGLEEEVNKLELKLVELPNKDEIMDAATKIAGVYTGKKTKAYIRKAKKGPGTIWFLPFRF